MSITPNQLGGFFMFQINYCDYNAINPDHDRINRPNGSGDYLFLYFLAPMRIFMDGKTSIAPIGSCILYPKGSPQIYESIEKFKNSYIHFTAPVELLDNFHLPLNQIFTLANHTMINESIKNIQIEFLSEEKYSKLMMDTIMKQLFVTISRELYHTKENPNIDVSLRNQFRNARLEILTHAEQDWTTESMSNLVHMGKSQFFHYYKVFFNTSPKAELINARIEKAKYLLNNEALQINQIAGLVGFQNVYHFTRYFKKCCGCTPGSYVKQFASKIPDK